MVADVVADVGCLKVIVMEVRGLKSIPSNKIVYCTMEVDGCDKLQTDQAEASKPWCASRRHCCHLTYSILADKH